ncbi:MAG: hypothetical protein IJ863_01885 [Spirochaetales bacterium]|nr:hypothetical protein [Spirochaetales bacterium]
MRRTVSVFILLVSFLAVLHAGKTAPYEHYMLGYVNAEVDFSVSILEDVLPFDLDGSEVAYNANHETEIRGLRIGEYTLISNSSAFELTIAHTPLEHRSGSGENDEGTLDSIDYRLYAVLGLGNLFYSSLSDPNANVPDNSTNRIRIAGDDSNVWTQGTTSLSIINRSLYVSLEDNTSGSTAETVTDLKAGLYESTIYFMLKGL